jgi:hypothetical protein
MRRFLIAVVAVAALAGPPSALASSSSIAHSNSGIGTVQPNGKVVQYRAAYGDPLFGPIACTGTHHDPSGHLSSTNLVGTIGGSFDSFTCTSTSGAPLTNVYPGETFAFEGWLSDYFLQTSAGGVFATSFTGTVSADGLSFSAVATY